MSQEYRTPLDQVDTVITVGTYSAGQMGLLLQPVTLAAALG